MWMSLMQVLNVILNHLASKYLFMFPQTIWQALWTYAEFKFEYLRLYVACDAPLLFVTFVTCSLAHLEAHRQACTFSESA